MFADWEMILTSERISTLAWKHPKSTYAFSNENLNKKLTSRFRIVKRVR